ncbi:MAG: hypothetical protein ABSC46_09355 [Candidatus Limnocylindrales bacterium]
MVNELWAKLSARERFIVFGMIAAVVGWLVGLILASNTYGVAGIATYSLNYYNAGNSGLLNILAMVAAVATLVVLYLKIAPNMNITWPMPIVQILLGLTAAVAVCGVLSLLIQVTNNLPDVPVMMYVADVLVIGGGAFAAFNAYQDFTAAKA